MTSASRIGRSPRADDPASEHHGRVVVRAIGAVMRFVCLSFAGGRLEGVTGVAEPLPRTFLEAGWRRSCLDEMPRRLPDDGRTLLRLTVPLSTTG